MTVKDCPYCHGEGYTPQMDGEYVEDRPCIVCRGRGKVPRAFSLDGWAGLKGGTQLVRAEAMLRRFLEATNEQS